MTKNKKIKKLNKTSINYLKLKKRMCPVCGSSKKIKLFNENNWKKMDANGNIYIIDKKYCLCKNCNLIYTNPSVSAKVFDKLYSNSVVGSFFNYKSTKNLKKIFYFENLCKKYLNSNLNVLEIGSGNGFLLKYLYNKYNLKKKNLTGIEPSRELFKKFYKNKFFKIKNVFLNNLKVKNRYDFIIMDNVFEHFDFPNNSLKKIHKLLKNYGLVYISIPNVEKLRITQSDPFNHTCNYNVDNIKNILNNNSFKILKFSKDSNLINIIAKKNKNIIKEFKNNKNFIKRIKSKIKKINKKMKTIDQKVIKLKNKIVKNEEKIVVFGLGNYALWILNKLKIFKNISYGVDNNIIYQNKKRNNINIYHPFKLKKRNYDKILILSYAFKKDIIKQILEMNIPKNKIITI